MKLQDLTTKDLKITSLELLQEMNFFRIKEGNKSTNHRDLMIMIETEFADINRKRVEGGMCPEVQYLIEERLTSEGILISEYTHEQNKKVYPMYILTTNQAKQMLMKESRFVRRAVIQYIENLERELEALKLSTGTKKKQIEAMELLHKFLPELEKTEAMSYIKANSVVNKITSNIHGFPKMLKKDEMSPIMILTRDKVLDEYVKLYEVLDDNHEVSEVLKRKYEGKLIQ